VTFRDTIEKVEDQLIFIEHNEQYREAGRQERNNTIDDCSKPLKKYRAKLQEIEG